MSEYIQRFREVKNRCYSSRITEKEAVDLAVLGLAKPIKDMAFQLEFASLAHLVQKLTAYELYHLELYQDKFKRHVNMAQADESDDSGEEQEVAVAEWTRGGGPRPVQMDQTAGACEGLRLRCSQSRADIRLTAQGKAVEAPRESQATNRTRVAGEAIL